MGFEKFMNNMNYLKKKGEMCMIEASEKCAAECYVNKEDQESQQR